MVGWLVALSLEFLVVLGAWFAWKDGTLTVRQLVRKYGPGLPFNRHGGMWGNIPLSFLLGYVVYQYGDLWSKSDTMIALVVAIVASSGMVYSYKLTSTPEAHIINRQVTRAGYVLLISMTVMLTIVLLFYFATPGPEPTLVIWTSASLVGYIIVGTHVPLGLIAPEWYPGRPLSNPATYIVILGCALGLAWRTMVLIR